MTARYNSPFVKEYIEERDLDTYIVIDYSKSNEFGSSISKKEISIQIAATLIFSALANNDNIGLAIFTNKIERIFKPKKGKKHALLLLRYMLTYRPKNKTTDLRKTLIDLTKYIKKRSIVFIISDYITSSFSKPLKYLSSNNDVTLINIRDSLEKEIPNIGLVYVEDEETGEQILIDTSDNNFRKIFKKKQEIFEKNLTKLARKNKANIVNIETSEDYYLPLLRYFRKRELKAY